jgi:hypothetical protein
VAADKIKAQSIEEIGAILVTWGAGYDAESYDVWRRELRDGTPDEGTARQLVTGSKTSSPLRKIPYYRDDSIKDGTSYQYGVVVNSYKSASGDARPKSEIVWQAVSPENPAAQGRGRVDAATTAKTPVTSLIGDVKDDVEAAVTKYDTSAPGNSSDTNYPDKLSIRISGLTRGYRYTFYYQTVQPGSEAVTADWPDTSETVGHASAYSAEIEFPLGTPGAPGTPGTPSTPPVLDSSIEYTYQNFVGHYLDTGSWVYEPVLNIDSRLSDGSSTKWQHWLGRIVVRVEPLGDDKYYTYSNPDTTTDARLRSDEAVVASPFGPTSS